jgi:hypothetical protein
MFTDPRTGGAPLRSARECVLGVFAAWLVVQNLALAAALLLGGAGAAWRVGAPLLGVAFLCMTPLWIVPAALLVAGRMAGRRAHCPETREVRR